MEKKIADTYVKFKKANPKHLFQFTRSCDFRVATCTALIEKDGSLSKSVALVSEPENLTTMPDAFYEIFTFSEPRLCENNIYETSIGGFPSRKLFLHTNKYVVMTEIAKQENVLLIGVHVTVDMPARGPPLLRGVQLIGMDKRRGCYITEQLPLRPFLKQFSMLCKDFVVSKMS